MRSAALFLALLAASAPAEPPADEPLPEGARLRLGTDRMRHRYGWPAGTLTPDGRHLVTPQNVRNVLIDVTTGRDAGELPGLPADFSADGKRAASANGIVFVWDLPGGKKRQATKRQLPNYALDPVSLSADGKLLAVGTVGDSGERLKPLTAVVWDVDADRQIAEVAVEQNDRVAVRLSPDGKTLATFGSHTDRTRKLDAKNPAGWPEQVVQLWNAADGKPLGRVAVAGTMVAAVAFSPDGSLLAVSAGEGLVTLHDSRSGTEKHQLFGRSYVGSRLAFSPDGKVLAAASLNGRVQRWTVADGRLLDATDPPVEPQNGPAFLIRQLLFTAPDRAVAWGVLGSVAVVWEIPSGRRLSPAGGHHQHVTSVGFTPDGKHVLTGGYDGGILRWNAATGELVGPVVVRPPWLGTALPTILILPDATRGVSDHSGTSVYDLTRGEELFRLPTADAGQGRGYVVHVSADGTKAVTRVRAERDEKDDRYEAWDLAAPKRLGGVAMPKSDGAAVGISSDGSKLVTLIPRSGAAEVSGWEVATGKKLATLTAAEASGALAAVPGAEPLALLPTRDGKLAVVDYAAGKVARTLDPGRGGLSGAPVFSADGKQYATAFQNDAATPAGPHAEIRAFGWPDGKLLHTFRGHSQPLSCLAFAPDGKTLASGSTDTTVLLWGLGKSGK